MENKFIDISVPIHQQLPVWPGDARVQIDLVADMNEGDICNVSRLQIGAHTGTHIDSPLHFLKDGTTTDTIDLQKMNGPCFIAECYGKQRIGYHDLDNLKIPDNTNMLLLKTDNSAHWSNPSHDFVKSFCALTKDGAEWVVEHKLDLIGIDYLSIALFDDPPEIVHQILLKKNIVILETIDLRDVAQGFYHLHCFPLKIAGVEGNPVRAVLTYSHW